MDTDTPNKWWYTLCASVYSLAHSLTLPRIEMILKKLIWKDEPKWMTELQDYTENMNTDKNETREREKKLIIN